MILKQMAVLYSPVLLKLLKILSGLTLFACFNSFNCLIQDGYFTFFVIVSVLNKAYIWCSLFGYPSICIQAGKVYTHSLITVDS